MRCCQPLQRTDGGRRADPSRIGLGEYDGIEPKPGPALSRGLRGQSFMNDTASLVRRDQCVDLLLRPVIQRAGEFQQRLA